MPVFLGYVPDCLIVIIKLGGEIHVSGMLKLELVAVLFLIIMGH